MAMFLAILVDNRVWSQNAYLIYIDTEGDPSAGELKPTAKLVYIFPILPSVTWNFKF